MQDPLTGYDLWATPCSSLEKFLAYNDPLDNDRFREQIEKALGRQIGYKQRGCPEAKKLDREIA